jgi:hypothetical protein
MLWGFIDFLLLVSSGIPAEASTPISGSHPTYRQKCPAVREPFSMFNSTTLEVAIGMALIYLLLSLFCTAINEGIAGILGSRAKNLENGIKSLFTEGLKTAAKNHDTGASTPAVTLAEAIYDHGLVQSLYRSTPIERAAKWYARLGSDLPSYIPTRIFASALLDVIFSVNKTITSPVIAVGGSDATTPTVPLPPAALPSDLSTMLSTLEDLPDSKGKQAIITLVKQSGGDIVKLRQALENWYDDGMDRVAGWYKRKTQLVLFFIGLIIAVCLNVDSITIGRTLWVSPALRSYAVTTAEQYANEKSKTLPSADAPRDLSVLQSLALPVGWNTSKYPWMEERGAGATYSQSFSFSNLLFVLVGWLLTAIAMTLGAPFWFDTLNQFMVVRSTIKPREKSEVEGSKDSKG